MPADWIRITIESRKPGTWVVFGSVEGGVPGEDDWDRDKHIVDVRAQADLGVTYQAVNAVGSTRAEVLDMIRSYGDRVISPLR